MKKILIALLSIILISGCSKNNNVLGEIEKSIEGLYSYHLVGDLTIYQNDDKYSYKVDVSNKESYYRVSLINKNNSHEQIILKNEEGVYVVTPSLNKSFKFQSEWPVNSSQSYILKCLLNDIKKDSERTIMTKEEYYEISAKVDYPNNAQLKEEIIKFDKKTFLPKEVYVKDENNSIALEMKITLIEANKKYESDYFKLSNNIKEDISKETSTTLDSVVYPMYLPAGTTYSKEEMLKEENSERVILTYKGEKPFTLIEEKAKRSENHQTVNTTAQIVMYKGVVGVLTPTSLTWSESGTEFYLIGEDLSQMELLKIASSTSSTPITK